MLDSTEIPIFKFDPPLRESRTFSEYLLMMMLSPPPPPGGPGGQGCGAT